MLELLIQSYLSLLLYIGAGSGFVILVGLYWILRPTKTLTPANNLMQLSNNVMKDESHKENQHVKHDFHHDHIAAIAGADLVATQLDLARALIETGKKQSAKNILDDVIAQGNATQQLEAQHLQQRL